MRKILALIVLVLMVVSVGAQDVELELVMPGSYYYPGMLFFLDLQINNNGPAVDECQLYLGVSFGTDDMWFYPGWVQYPSSIDWADISIEAGENQGREILPDFHWPAGTASAQGCVFFAALIQGGDLISNVASCHFGCSGEPLAPPDMVYIPLGTFMMGSPEDEWCRSLGEVQHQVTLTRGFYMMTTEFTRQMWHDMRLVRPHLPADPSVPDSSPTMQHPVAGTTWYEILFLANEMSIYHGYRPCYYKDTAFTRPYDSADYGLFVSLYFDYSANGFRLPTEAEWEYAARAGTTGPFGFDEPAYDYRSCSRCPDEYPLEVLAQHAWYLCNSGFYYENQVGQKLPNGWGLFDMFGNAMEWCNDTYGDYPTDHVTDPYNFDSYEWYIRAVRGGGIRSEGAECRSAFRISCHPFERTGVGFRLVRTIE